MCPGPRRKRKSTPSSITSVCTRHRADSCCRCRRTWPIGSIKRWVSSCLILYREVYRLLVDAGGVRDFERVRWVRVCMCVLIEKDKTEWRVPITFVTWNSSVWGVGVSCFCLHLRYFNRFEGIGLKNCTKFESMFYFNRFNWDFVICVTVYNMMQWFVIYKKLIIGCNWEKSSEISERDCSFFFSSAFYGILFVNRESL